MPPALPLLRPLLLGLAIPLFAGLAGPARATQGGPDGFGYTWDDSIAFNYEAAATALNQGDNDFDVVSIGFNFEYYGNTYSQVTVASDGVIHFDGAAGVGGENLSLPTGSARLIAPLWDNLRPDGGGDVYYSTHGLAPTRVFIAEWRDVAHYATYSPYYTAGDATFEVKLFESGGGIEFHYQDVQWGDASYDNGASATIGIQEGSMGYALERSFGAAVLADGMAIRFEPCGDEDGDGYEEEFCGGTDCDDTDPAIHPLVPEIACDWVDNNCDGTLHGQETDDDYDGWDECLGDCDDTDPALNLDDTDMDGFTSCDGDCDDFEATALPGGTEVCDGGIDNDCDGNADDVDGDADGYVASECGGDDCDDTNPLAHPAGIESCNGFDDDCNGTVDDQDALGCVPYFYDSDGDGYGLTGDARCLCFPTAPYSAAFGGDCDDTNAGVNPGAIEDCNWIDDNCNGSTDEGFDGDGDGYNTCDNDCDDANPAINPAATEYCNLADDNCNGVIDEGFDTDGDGYSACGGDCDDNDPAINPLAVEQCDGVDENCDGLIDEPFDLDADGSSTCMGDCDDADGTVYPGAPELCDGLDNDCDGHIDPGEIDQDGDGWSTCEGDCRENDPDIHPGAPEQCDGIDNDCDGVTDEDTGVDLDGDGFNACQGDCDDDNVDTYPGADEICDGEDNDCDDILPPDEVDDDHDGAFVCDDDCDDDDPAANLDDLDGDGYTTCDYDCDDHEIAVYPGNPEVCDDGLDNDCNGAIDSDDEACGGGDDDDASSDDDGFPTGACECRAAQGATATGLVAVLGLIGLVGLRRNRR